MSTKDRTKTSSSPRRRRSVWLIPLGCLLTTGALIGLSTNLAKLASEVGLAPLAFLAWAVTGAAAVLTVVQAVRGRLPELTRQTVEYFAVSGLVSVAAPNLLFFAAAPRIGAGFVALSIAFPPLFTYVGALLLGMERFRAGRAAGVTLALSGAALLAALKLSAPGAAPPWIAATFLAPVLLAVGNIYRTARWPDGATPDQLAPGMLGASGLMLLAPGALVALAGIEGTRGGFSLAVPTGSWAPALLILVQVAVFSVMYLLFFVLQKRGGPVYLSLLGSVAAVVGVPIAVFLLGEAPPDGLASGGALIALGVGLVTLGGPKGT